jgi:hypothetical protein
MRRYRFVLNEAAARAAFAATFRERSALAIVFESLAEDPHRHPDLIYMSPEARTLSVKNFNRWRITYWIDEAVCEVRIVDIIRASTAV